MYEPCAQCRMPPRAPFSAIGGVRGEGRLVRHGVSAGLLSLAWPFEPFRCMNIIWVAVKELKLSHHNGYI